MTVHTFRAASLQAALQLVRESLGPDAAIVCTRQQKPSRLGLFSKPLIEVEATLEQRNRLQATSAVSTSLRPLASQPAISEAPTPPLTQSASLTSPELVPAIQAELLECGLDQRWASQLITQALAALTPAQVVEASQLRRQIGRQVAGMIACAQPDLAGPRHSKVMAFIGPTGVGKTTCLAKIATAYRWQFNSSIGLLAVDTQRLGAVDQLLQYAEMLSAPLEVVSSTAELVPALERLQACSLVMMDTAGRNPRDPQQLKELRSVLQLAQPTATLLVLSATSSVAHLEQSLRAFTPLGATQLVLSKLDEAPGLASWLPTLAECRLSLSYLSHGQHVPQDIVPAETSGVIAAMFGATYGPAN